jgi:hypothetical protein
MSGVEWSEENLCWEFVFVIFVIKECKMLMIFLAKKILREKSH